MMKKHWINQIEDIGSDAVERALGVTYETVRTWRNGQSLPRGKNKKNLLSFFENILSRKKYEEFKASLASDFVNGH